MLTDLLVPAVPGLQLTTVVPKDGAIYLTMTTTQLTASCPDCQQRSARVHSRYTRRLADLPWASHPVHLTLHVRRFFCDQPSCSRRTFAERLDPAIRPRARRTTRHVAHLQRLAFALGGAAGASQVAHLGMPASASTLLRLQRRTILPLPPAPTIIGVDDWAFRKGRTYGALIVDLERHRPLDVLPDKKAATFAAWLKQHPGIRVISRDRDSAFADGAKEGAPEAIQVADRWHLHQNLGDALQRLLHRHPAALRAAVLGDHDPVAGDAPEVIAAPVLITVPVAQPLHSERTQRFQQVLSLHEQGWSHVQIAREVGLNWRTVKRYIVGRELPKRGAPCLQATSTVRPYATYIEQRWNAGCQNGMVLWKELRAQGFEGSYSAVCRALKRFRTGDGRRLGTRRAAAPKSHPLTPRQAMWLLVRADEQLSERDQRRRAALQAAHPAIATAAALALRLGRILRERTVADFAPWLDDATDSGVAELRDFARGLRRDKAAVMAALQLPYSNAQLEGQINRLKLIKRTAYGRAGFDLLRQRVLYAA